MVTIHLHLVLQLKISGPVPLLPLYAFMTWTGTTLLTLPISINGYGITQLFYKARNSGLILYIHVTVRRYGFLFNNQPVALIIQIYSVIKLYVFRATSLPIIRSFLLYIRHW